MSQFCPKFQRVWWYYDAENKRVVMGRLRCKQWDCDYCARENMKMWRSFLNRRLRVVANDWHSLTLTAPRDRRGRLESYKALQSGIDILMKRFRRAFGDVQYVRVFEKHPTSDALHAHFIVSGLTNFVKVERRKNGKDGYRATNFRKGKRGFWSLKTFVKKTAQSSGMGYMADVKPITRDGGAVRYVTEYMTKSAQGFDIKGLRRVQTTRRIGSPKTEAKNVVYSAYRLSKKAIVGDMMVLDTDTGELIPHEFWAENNVYPSLSS